MRSKPYSFKEGTIVALGLMSIGLLLQLCIGPIDWALVAWPVNIIILSVYVFALILVYTLRKKVYAFEWAMHYKAAVPALAICAISTTIYGITNWSGTLTCWPFAIIYAWITTIIGLASINRASRLFSSKSGHGVSFYINNVAFLLNHLGLFIAIISATLGNSDLQRLKMQVETAQPEWRALEDKTHHVVELPIAIQLDKFTLEEYPAKLMIADTKANTTLDDFMLLEDTLNLPKQSLGNWMIEVKSYYEYCIPIPANDSISFSPHKQNGAVTSAYITATNIATGKSVSGWVSNNSSMYSYQALNLDGQFAVIMPDREPKRFVSEIEVFTESGKHERGIIEVNKPLSIEGWNIYQYSYDTAEGRWSQISVFELVKDPWLPIVYTGIYMLIAGAVLQFITAGKRKEEEND